MSYRRITNGKYIYHFDTTEDFENARDGKMSVYGGLNSPCLIEVGKNPTSLSANTIINPTISDFKTDVINNLWGGLGNTAGAKGPNPYPAQIIPDAEIKHYINYTYAPWKNAWAEVHIYRYDDPSVNDFAVNVRFTDVDVSQLNKLIDKHHQIYLVPQIKDLGSEFWHWTDNNENRRDGAVYKDISNYDAYRSKILISEPSIDPISDVPGSVDGRLRGGFYAPVLSYFEPGRDDTRFSRLTYIPNYYGRLWGEKRGQKYGRPKAIQKMGINNADNYLFMTFTSRKLYRTNKRNSKWRTIKNFDIGTYGAPDDTPDGMCITYAKFNNSSHSYTFYYSPELANNNNLVYGHPNRWATSVLDREYSSLASYTNKYMSRMPGQNVSVLGGLIPVRYGNCNYYRFGPYTLTDYDYWFQTMRFYLYDATSHRYLKTKSNIVSYKIPWGNFYY